MRRTVTAMLAAALAGTLGACQPAPPEVDDAWVRLPAVPGRPAAAYFTIEGGERTETLIAARTASAGRVELHETVATGMRPIADVPLPAKQDVVFAPGGKHVMLYDVAASVKPGGKMMLELVLDRNQTLSVEADVVGAADPAP